MDLSNATTLSPEAILSAALDVGEGMLRAGGEISRIEDTVERICRAYGAKRVDVFCITSVIIASAVMRDGQRSSQLRRIDRTAVDLLALELYNSLSRRICSEKPPVSKIRELISEAKRKRIYPFPLCLTVAALTAGVLAISFGGALRDGLAAAIIGVVIFLTDRKWAVTFNRSAKIALIAFTAGSLACISVTAGIAESAASVMIGTVLLLIPGLAFGTALRNLISGDTLSGMLEIIRAIVNAMMIAIGYLLSMLIFRNTYQPITAEASELVRFITLALGVLGFAVIFNIRKRHLLFVLIGGIGTYLCFYFSTDYGMGILVSTILASGSAAVYSELCARVLRAPSVVFLLPCAIPIVPGKSLYNAASNLLLGNSADALSFMTNAASAGLGIALGIVFASVAVSLAVSARSRMLLYRSDTPKKR